ncbi:hypothetical protein, partial [Escherichia coli]|uniref:hypothetical protein n=1 Tax=Escherichia coli TaxID=562 RepID=UPI00312C9246
MIDAPPLNDGGGTDSDSYTATDDSGGVDSANDTAIAPNEISQDTVQSIDSTGGTDTFSALGTQGASSGMSLSYDGALNFVCLIIVFLLAKVVFANFIM